MAPGRATATLVLTSAMMNGHGNCHGGYLFQLAHLALAFACNTHGPPAVASGADVTVRRGDKTVVEFRGRSRTMPGRP